MTTPPAAPHPLDTAPGAVPTATDLVAAAAPAAVTTRSGLAESLHHGVGATVLVAPDATARQVASLGDPALVVLPRSALKLVHAVAFLEVGLDVPDDLLALVCASHSGEPEHVATARRLLDHAGLGPDDLDNTPDLPIDAAAAARQHEDGPRRLTQNCSGNHAGMLAAAVAAGWPTAGYTRPDHPVQQAIARTLDRLAGGVSAHVAVDGCGAPAFATTVRGLALAYARLAAAEPGSPEARVRDAVASHPWLVGGTGRRNTRLMRAFPGLAVKDGADGVMAAAWRRPDGSGAGVAVKVLDGADRARGVTLAEGLRAAGLDVPEDAPGVGDDVLGHGEPVGAVRALPWRAA